MTKPTSAPKIPLSPKARDEISKLQAILDAFNHRNKNQHRLSPWWSRFNILRRALRALSHEKNAAVVVPVADVLWLKDPVVPRCYVSFSQLAADNQHAALGLMLLVVIARVNTIVNDLLPPTVESNPTRSVKEAPAEDAGGSKQSGGDKGVKIQRNAITDTPTTAASTEHPKKKRSPVPTDEPKKKKKKKSKDEFSSLFGSLA